jgi:tetratricopeptide (TPR) repeat protein
VLRHATGDTEGALEAALMSLAIDEARHQRDPEAASDLAFSLGQVATSLFALRRPDEALVYAQREMELKRSVGDTIGLNWAGSLRNLGAIYARAGQPAQAEQLMRQGLEAALRAGGPDHPRVASMAAILGQLVTEQGRPAEGEQLQRRALAVREAALGSDHVEVGISHELLASTLATLGKGDEARRHATRAREIYVAQLGADHPYVGDADAILARVDG